MMGKLLKSDTCSQVGGEGREQMTTGNHLTRSALDELTGRLHANLKQRTPFFSEQHTTKPSLHRTRHGANHTLDELLRSTAAHWFVTCLYIFSQHGLLRSHYTECASSLFFRRPHSPQVHFVRTHPPSVSISCGLQFPSRVAFACPLGIAVY